MSATPAWGSLTASVRGASHVRTDLPNQDAVRVLAGDGVTVAAVADGHGGSRYVRSDRGSGFAVDLACRLALDLAATHLRSSAEQVRRRFAPALVQSVLDAWSSAVHRDVAAEPFTDAERSRGGGDLDAEPLISYGCTLVLAVVAPAWICLIQIGDGDITVVADDGTTSAPVPGDDRLVGGETTSLCLPSAPQDARVAVLTEPLPALVVLTSDGYANSFADASWRHDVGPDLLHQVETIGLEGIGDRLEGWLNDSAVAGGDDVSMALLARPATLGSTPGPPAPPSRSTRTTRPARSFPAGLIAATLTLGVFAGGAAGWLIGANDDRSHTPPSATSTTLTASTTTSVQSTTTTSRPIRATIEYATDAGATGLVTFDPIPGAAHPVLLGTIATTKSVAALPSPWTLKDGTLKRGQRQVQRGVTAATATTTHVWVLIDDGEQLLAFNLAGNPAGEAESVVKPGEIAPSQANSPNIAGANGTGGPSGTLKTQPGETIDGE